MIDAVGNPPPYTETVGMPVNKLLPLDTGNVIPVIAPFVMVAAAVAYPVPENTNVGADVKPEPPVVTVYYTCNYSIPTIHSWSYINITTIK